MPRWGHLAHMLVLGVAVACGFSPQAARAEPQPAYLPMRDVVVTYRVGGRAAREVRQLSVRFAAATQRMRVETDDQGMGHLLVDIRARTARMVLPGVGQYVDLPLARDRRTAFLFGDRLRFTRRGGSRLLGLPCNMWDVQSGRDQARACITGDGVILHAEGRAGAVAGSRIDALRVDFIAQPGRLFDVPQGAGALGIQDLLRPLMRTQ